MTRILEFIVAAIFVLALAVVIGLVLPSAGHVERTAEVSHNLRHINDLLTNFRRFPEWGVLRALDPKTQFTLEGPDFGKGAKINWQSAQSNVGNGFYEVADNQQDAKVVWTINNPWKGENKRYTITLEPQKNGKITKVTWAYDVDYGMNLVARYSGLYLHGEPANQISINLASLQSRLATIPNVDYTQTDIFIADVSPKPQLVVATTAPRSLDEVAAATATALTEIQAVMKKNNLNPAGPHSVITTEWGDENYVFEVAQPVDSAALTIDGKSFTIAQAVAQSLAEQNDEEAAPVELAPGQFDKKGNLVVAGNVRARTGYAGKALVTTWVGSPAGLPLMRLSLKAYALSRGYRFNDTVNRYFDIMLSDPATVPDDEQVFKVYLPITDDVAANEPAEAPVLVPSPAAAQP